MALQTLLELMNTDKTLRQLTARPVTDSTLQRFIEESPQKQQAIVQATLASLNQGKDVHLRVGERFERESFVEHVGQLTGALNFRVEETKGNIKLMKGSETPVYVAFTMDGNTTSLHHKALVETMFSAVGQDNVLAYLKSRLYAGDRFDLRLKNRMGDRLKPSHISKLARKVQRGIGNGFNVLPSKQGLRLEVPRGKVELNLVPYDHVDVDPARFRLQLDHLGMIGKKDLSDHAREYLRERLRQDRSGDYTLLLAYAQIQRGLFRGVERMLSTLHHPLAWDVYCLFGERELTAKNDIADMMRNVQPDDNVEIAFARLRPEDREYFNQFMEYKPSSAAVDAKLRQMLALSFAYKLSDEYGVVVVGTTKPKSTHLTGTPLHVEYKDSGKRITVKEGRNYVCELDGMIAHDGIPIVVTCEPNGSSRSYKTAENTAKRIFGVEPCMLDFTVRDNFYMDNFGDNYRCAVPLEKQLKAKITRVFAGQERL